MANPAIYVFTVPMNQPTWEWDQAAEARSQNRLQEEWDSLVEFRLQNRGVPILQPMTREEVRKNCRGCNCREQESRVRDNPQHDKLPNLQARDFLYDPTADNIKRYGKFPAVDSIMKWATRDEDYEDDLNTILGQFDVPREELHIYPEGFQSVLELDTPLFLEKTMFLLDGEVNCRVCNSRVCDSRVRDSHVTHGHCADGHCALESASC
jgi:hypothetical protein